MVNRYKLLDIKYFSKTSDAFKYINPEIKKNLDTIEINQNKIYSTSIFIKPQKVTVCYYNKYLFFGVDKDNKISFTLEKQDSIPFNLFSLEINKLFNFLKQNKNAPESLLGKWEKVRPLLDKVIDIEEQYRTYKKEYNQYKEINIPNNGFIGNKEDLINQCVFLFECYQSIDNSEFSIDFDSMSVTKNGISYISIENGQIYNNVNETDIKNDLDKLVSEYINNLQDEVQNQLNLLHKEQGLASIINFKGNKKIYDIKDKKDKNVFHYELKENNINQLLDCKLKISKLRQTLEKEQNKMNETTYINEHDIER